MRKRFLAPLLLIALAALALSSFGTSAASKDTLDIIGTASNPAGHSHPNGANQNWTVDSDIAPGGSFTVDLRITIAAESPSTTSIPRTVSLGPGNGTNAGVTVGSISNCVFNSVADVCTRTVTITVPNTGGTYLAKIDATGGTGNDVGLSGGNGLNIHFDVSSAPPVGCQKEATSVSVEDICAIYHQPSATLSATLTKASDDSPLEGRTIRFEVDGTPAGTASTDSGGTATLIYDTSSLSVGDHSYTAYYDGEECYDPTNNTAGLDIKYASVTFRPPVDPTGPALFRSVKTIPVKIIVTDYYGVAVPDAEAHVYFAKYTSNTTTEVPEVAAEPLANTNGDSGNLMRYSDGQYIFNWNTTGLTDGKYRIRVDLGEGTCASSHTADVTFKRK